MTRTLPASIIALGAILLAASAGTTASAAGAPTDTRTAVTVDCLVGEGSNDNQVILPGETLTVTLLNCDGWNVADEDAGTTLRDPADAQVNDWDAIGSPVVFTVTGASNIDMDEPLVNPGTVSDIDIDVFVASPAAAPSGVLNLTTRLTMPVQIPDFEIDVPVDPVAVDTAAPAAEPAGDDDRGEDTTEPVALAPAALLGGLPDCQMEDGYHPYQTLPISISIAGDFTFRVIDVTPVDEDLQWGQPYLPSQDFFLAVYTTFDPENPEVGLVDCNDNRPVDHIFVVNGGVTYLSDDQTPEFIATLAPGDYTLVLSTYRTTSSSEWAAGQFSPWSGVSDLTWNPQPMTALFELWGPTGSIALDPEEEELAETGPPTGSTAALAGLGILAALGGSILLLSRRRRQRA